MHINRAGGVYLVIFALFAAGIWAILEMGNALLTAPRDLSGVWQYSGPKTDSFTIAQSGRFLRFTVDGGPRFDVVMASTSPPNSQNLNFDGQGWHVTESGQALGDTLSFTFQPPASSPAPASGTYQRQRIGQPTAPPVQSPPRQAPQ
jgi:hypothetical protein